ncbi:HNH endonuclease [Bacillus sp. FJAT-22090]|uniref:HNH endonuclease n=1 Tax=Bacillus sp. FJAT-22090 TaxID=1581038 RepID=UPI0011A46281|nr:HNH endonuclease [Bacillus sp. FJAT-22090]
MESKECKWCGETKSIVEFYSTKKFSKTKGEYIYYNPECKKCRIEASTKWRKDPKNRESFLQSQIKRNRHPDHLIERENAYKRRKEEGYFKNYYNENKDMFKKYSMMHRNHDITKEEWEDCKKYFDYSCAYCGIAEDDAVDKYGQKLHKEHVDHDGANDVSNCIPACKSCNSRKWIHKIDDWYNFDNEIYSYYRHFKIIKWLDYDYKIS